MDHVQLTLTAEEQRFLHELLEHVLNEKKIEEHRTDAIAYKQFVVHQEGLISNLLNKLAGQTMVQ